MSDTQDSNFDADFDFGDNGGDADPFADFGQPAEKAGAGSAAEDPFSFDAPPPPPKASAPGSAQKPKAQPPTSPNPAPQAPQKPGNVVSSQTASSANLKARSAGLAADVPLQIVAVMGKKSMTVKELISLKKGEVVELNRFPNEAIDLVANGKLMAKGELVEIDGKLGVRIIKLFD